MARTPAAPAIGNLMNPLSVMLIGTRVTAFGYAFGYQASFESMVSPR